MFSARKEAESEVARQAEVQRPSFEAAGGSEGSPMVRAHGGREKWKKDSHYHQPPPPRHRGLL